jgi:hypothetical protein
MSRLSLALIAIAGMSCIAGCPGRIARTAQAPTARPDIQAVPPNTWVGRFSGPGGCGDKTLYPYQAPAPNSWVFCVFDPEGSGQTVLAMNVCGTCYGYEREARADWDSPRNIAIGSNVYFSVPVLVPRNADATLPSGRSFMIDEVYGAPGTDSPSNSIDILNTGHRLIFVAGGNTSGRPGGGRVLWSGTTANDGQWHDFIFHMVLSTRAATGLWQIWEDGKRIRFNGRDCDNDPPLSGCGTTTLHFPTVIPGATDASNQWLQINNYRNWGNRAITTVVFHGAPAVGPTYASVQRTIVGYPHGP